MKAELCKQRLLDLQAELINLERESSESNQTVVELDQQKVGRLSRMDAMQTQAMSQEANRRRKIRLARITLALQHLEEGDYGYCAVCDEAIADARLDFDPTVTMCVNCAGKLERKTELA
jgi:DnaK suppressor protein